MSWRCCVGEITVLHGDSRELLKSIPDCSIDACVCDPPYALVSIVRRFGKPGSAEAKAGATGAYQRASAGFMGKSWDNGETAFDPLFWAEVWRVLKPGAHVVAFSGTRTYHRLACAVEDGGFEIRDMLAWLYGSGFPKSHDVSKGIDKRRNDTSEIVRVAAWLRPHVERVGFAEVTAHFGFKDETMARARWTSSSQPNVPRWEQWLQLKALCDFSDEMDTEVWRLNGRKGTPGEAWAEREVVGQGYRVRRESTVQVAGNSDGEYNLTSAATEAARQWEGWGTALKPALEPIVFARKPLDGTVVANVLKHGTGAIHVDACRVGDSSGTKGCDAGPSNGNLGNGLNGSFGMAVPGLGRWPANVVHDGSDEVVGAFPANAGAFAPVRGTEPSNAITNVYGARERTATMHHGDSGSAARFFYSAKAGAEDRMGSKHPTVKPVDLMRWLVTLVTPPGGTVLDPFAGTGSTGLAAMGAGFDCVLMEREAEYVADIERRLAWARGEGKLTAQEIGRNRPQSPIGGLFDFEAEDVEAAE